MFRANVFIENDVLNALRETAQQTPKRLRAELGKIARGTEAQALIRELGTEPGSPHYPLRWKSDKQRRYVMAKLRRENNIPYKRTHKLARGWQVVLESVGQDDSKGIFLVKNDTRYVRYVQGADTQPFHLDTGWPQAEPIIRRSSSIFEDKVIDAWYKIVSNGIRNR